ncbi:MAG: hypothetical protein HIU89_02705 [Proteobacteria bacterium]|nr:hypothetical protein [Pseudomonadota bacterium]
MIRHSGLDEVLSWITAVTRCDFFTGNVERMLSVAVRVEIESRVVIGWAIIEAVFTAKMAQRVRLVRRRVLSPFLTSSG